MTITGLVVLLLIGAVCGAVAELLVGYSPGGLLVSIAVGLVGAYLGAWGARRLGLPVLLEVTVEGHRIELVWAVVGAILLLLVLRLLRRPYAYRDRYR